MLFNRMMSKSLDSTSFSPSWLNISIQHLLFIPSRDFIETLYDSKNLVVLLIILSACWAPTVQLSASSRMTIFYCTSCKFTFFKQILLFILSLFQCLVHLMHLIQKKDLLWSHLLKFIAPSIKYCFFFLFQEV